MIGPGIYPLLKDVRGRTCKHRSVPIGLGTI